MSGARPALLWDSLHSRPVVFPGVARPCCRQRRRASCALPPGFLSDCRRFGPAPGGERFGAFQLLAVTNTDSEITRVHVSTCRRAGVPPAFIPTRGIAKCQLLRLYWLMINCLSKHLGQFKVPRVLCKRPHSLTSPDGLVTSPRLLGVSLLLSSLVAKPS